LQTTEEKMEEEKQNTVRNEVEIGTVKLESKNVQQSSCSVWFGKQNKQFAFINSSKSITYVTKLTHCSKFFIHT
jgi:hypothetical protein